MKLLPFKNLRAMKTWKFLKLAFYKSLKKVTKILTMKVDKVEMAPMTKMKMDMATTGRESSVHNSDL